MDTMIYEILINTYNPNPTLRKQAEVELKQFLNNHGAFSSLLGFIQNQDIERDLRVAASIVAKNNARNYFRTDQEEVVLPISPEEKEAAKIAVVAILLVETDNVIRGLLAETIRAMSEFEYPHNWPDLLPTLLTHVQSDNILSMYNALLALRKLVKRYEYKAKSEREPLLHIVDVSFPCIQHIMSSILENNSIEAAHVLRLCLKVFWSCTQYKLPVVASVDVNLWFHVLSTLLSKPLPEASEGLEPADQPTDIEERNAWPWWKMKKWAARIVTHFIQRYGNPRYCEDEYKQFAEYFREHTAKLLLEPMVNILIQKSEGAFVTDIVSRMCITYVGNSVEMSPTYKIVKPHLDFILFGVILPTMSLTDEELSLFEDDPPEYIRRVHSPLEDWLDPRIAASNLLQMLGRYRLKDTLPKFLTQLQTLMDEYARAPDSMKDHRTKEAAIYTFATLSTILQEKKPYCNQLEGMMKKYIIPELQSPVGVVRARACWVMEHYSDMKWKSNRTLETIISGLLQGLRDPCLPVQAAAACSLRLQISSDVAKDMIRPILYDVVNEYFRIMGELDSDVVVGALQSIVMEFQDEIQEIFGLLITQLIQVFENFASAGEEDDEAAFGATQCLETIATVLEVIKDNEPAIIASEELLSPLIYKLISSDDFIEFLDNVIEMMSYLTYYPSAFNCRLWEIFGPMMVAVDDWGYDYMMEFTAPVMNFIAKDTATFMTGSFGENTYISMVLTVSQKALEHDFSDQEREAKAGAMLLACIIAHGADGNVDHLIEPIMSIVLTRLGNCKRKGLIERLIGVILAVIVYNPVAACEMFSANSKTEELIFQMMFDNIPHMYCPSSQRLIVAGFSALLALPKEQLPPFVQMNLQGIMSMLVRVLYLLDQDEDEGGEEEDEDDDEGDEEDDDDDEEEDEHDRPVGGAKVSKNTLRNLKALDVPEDGYDEDEDCVNAEDEEYLIAMAELAKQGNKYDQYGDDDLDETEEVATPLDTMDMVLLFSDTMNAAHARDPALFEVLQSNLDEEDQARLQGILENVNERRHK